MKRLLHNALVGFFLGGIVGSWFVMGSVIVDLIQGVAALPPLRLLAIGHLSGLVLLPTWRSMIDRAKRRITEPQQPVAPQRERH